MILKTADDTVIYTLFLIPDEIIKTVESCCVYYVRQNFSLSYSQNHKEQWDEK